MKTKFTLVMAILFGLSVSSFAQTDSIKITVDAALLGCTPGLVGESKVYMHSGAGTSSPTAVWEYVVGNWGQDDGVGELNATSTPDIWEITVHVLDYYSTAGNGPIPAGETVYGIGMVFRSADGTAEGKDKDCSDIFVRGLDGPDLVVENTDATPFDGVTAQYVYPAGLDDFANLLTDVRAIPNPAVNQTTINYNLNEQVDNLNIVVYNALGQAVTTLYSGSQTPGQHNVTWNLNNVDNGVYFYTLSNGQSTLTNKIMVVR